MLLKGFFRVQPFNPTLNKETLLFEKTTSGEYSYTIPGKYRGKTIRIVISGAGGGGWSGVLNQSDYSKWYAGNAEQYEYRFDDSNQNIISGIIGQVGQERKNASTPNGGTGYSNGGSGTVTAAYIWSSAGGGGGSSSLVIDGEFLYEACGGGGMNYVGVTGGKGGGPRGGNAGQNAGNGQGSKGAEWVRGGGAANTDGVDGYIRIYVLPL